MEKLVKEYLNSAFADRPLTREVIGERQHLKQLLLENIEKQKEENKNLSEQEIFSLVISKLEQTQKENNEEGRQQKENNEQKLLGKKVVGLFSFLNKYKALIPPAIWVVFLFIYLVSSGVSREWMVNLPLIIFSTYILGGITGFLVYKKIPTKWGIRELLLSFFITFSVFIFCYIVYLNGGAFEFSGIYWGILAIIFAISYLVLEKIFKDKNSLVSKLLLFSAVGLEIYFIAWHFLMGWRFVWLILVATALIDIILIIGRDKGKS